MFGSFSIVLIVVTYNIYDTFSQTGLQPCVREEIDLEDESSLESFSSREMCAVRQQLLPLFESRSSVRRRVHQKDAVDSERAGFALGVLRPICCKRQWPFVNSKVQRRNVGTMGSLNFCF